jgi:hypothetical protein
LVRAALLRRPDPPATFETVAPQHVYVPAAHRRALHPDAMVVSGMRGAGKSFWWHALLDSSARAAAALPEDDRLIVAPGFGEGLGARHPDRDALPTLLGCAGGSHRLVWRAVVLGVVRTAVEPGRAAPVSWSEQVAQVRADPGGSSEALRRLDARLAAEGRTMLVLFDALDRTSSAREDSSRWLAGVLELALDLRPTRAIRLKVFARPDMLDHPVVRGFPDASKMLQTRVSLTWDKTDLFALVLQYLGNPLASDEAALGHRVRRLALRAASRGSDLFEDGTDVDWPSRTLAGAERRDVPDVLRQEAAQKAWFESIAGPWMGANHRRGATYPWLPKHLADAAGAVSPRSFLAALRWAAWRTPSEHPFALYWKAIKAGVARASEIRVQEVDEDVPSASEALRALRGLLVPCPPEDVLARLEGLPNRGRPAEQLLRDLQDAYLVGRPRADGRLDVPDIVQVGFGLKRRGGVAPG